ncbi:phosphotransferase family protein [Gryllotalpicola ginsengisoli]|uniref:phosphotransferase family protein n=1 Tax=Gryllotalpicola ginsengisoli TaxID=444608 RepID=UPI0003B2E35F|nr:phosphotransferase [Gryllotalpicola ginsengisoli]
MLITDPQAIDTVSRLEARGFFGGSRVTAVEPLHRRSLCYRLRLADGRSLFVKRRSRATAESLAASFAYERRLTDALSARRIRIPAEFLAIAADDDEILVTEDLVGYAPLGERRAEAGGASEEWAYEVGRRLAMLHVATASTFGDGDDEGELDPELDRVRLPERLLAALSVVAPSANAACSDGWVEMLALVRHAGILRGLETAVSHWSPACIIHGDVSDDNMLCAETVAAREPVVFVDWESAGYGDPRWDVGCLVGDVLSTWLAGLDFRDGTTLAEWISDSAIPFIDVLAELRAALAGYESLVAASRHDRRQWARFAAFSLLERLASSAASVDALPPHALAYLQAAEQLALRPDAALELVGS